MNTELKPLLERIQKLRETNPKTDAEIAEWTWQNETLPKLRGVELPPRFHQRFTRWNPKQKKAYDLCRSKLTGTGAIVALIGPRGTGKSSIVAQIIIDRAEASRERPQGFPAPYTKMTDLINRFKPIYADFGSVAAERVTHQRDQFCGYSLRVIDELGECDEQRMKERVLVDILDRCYSGLTDTIIISNQTVEEFYGTTNSSILSRIAEHGEVIPCVWESFRSPEHKNNQGE